MNKLPTSESSGFIGNPEAKASQILWNKIIAMPIKNNSKPHSPNSKKYPVKSPKTTPIAKRTRNKMINKSPSQKSTLVSSGWLGKTILDKDLQAKENHMAKNLKDKYCKNTKTKKLWTTDQTVSKSKNEAGNKIIKPNMKKDKVKPKFERLDSGTSLSDADLPSFTNKKRNKQSSKKNENEGMKKYGVYVPTFDDIINERTDYEEYKAQVENAKTLQEPRVSLCFSPLKASNSRVKMENWLDCKHLSDDGIGKYFMKNINYLHSIKSGENFSERHCSYYDKKNQVATKNTTKDLTYNTSMIVFSHDQIDKMLELLREQFDPNDILSDYFFKVLVPELCLKIFMDCHGMNKKEAVEYLDQRPVE